MSNPKKIYKEASELDPLQQAKLIDKLISNLDKPDKVTDELWAKEVENRIDAYEQGKIKSVSLKEVLAKYN
ncbi:MAG: addiction module protein [bacterium]